MASRLIERSWLIGDYGNATGRGVVLQPPRPRAYRVPESADRANSRVQDSRRVGARGAETGQPRELRDPTTRQPSRAGHQPVTQRDCLKPIDDRRSEPDEPHAMGK